MDKIAGNFQMMTPDFQRFVAPAQTRTQIWRIILGVIIIVVSWMGLSIAIVVAAGVLEPDTGPVALLDDIQSGLTSRGMRILFLTFAGLLIGSMLACLVHLRSPLGIFGPARRLFGDFGRVLGITLVIYGAMIGIWMLIFEPVPNLEFDIWISVLWIGLAGLALQTLAEEAAFRGYLMQQLAARFKSPVIWMLIPSIAFGAVHFTPDAGLVNALLIVLATGFFGLVAADLTRRTGSLGAAWGLHMSNNIFALLVVAVDGTLPGMALWLTPYSMHDEGTLRIMLFVDIAMLAITWAILIRFLRR